MLIPQVVRLLELDSADPKNVPRVTFYTGGKFFMEW